MVAGRALHIMDHLLRRPAGWLICASSSNRATLHLLHQLVKYPSLEGYVHHGYSDMYKAYHATEFSAAFPYRITPNQEMGQHGILVCTLGTIARLLAKHPIITKSCFDFILDECGTVWEFDALLFLPLLPNLMRLTLSGDKNQLWPYITKLMKEGCLFPSILNLFPL